MLEGLGFKALATTSSGFAFTLGRRDGSVTLEEVVEHVRAMDRATNLPLSVDMENGFGPDPDSVATAIRRVAEAGAVGGSIEDFDRDGGHIYELDRAVDRITAAVEAARSLRFPFTLTARAENFVHDNPDLQDTISRLRAFETAGADVLFAPGLRNVEEIQEVCRAVAAPVNVLARPGLTLTEIVEAGARRVSVGGAFTWVAVNAMAEAARSVQENGDFSPLAVRLPLDEWITPFDG